MEIGLNPNNTFLFQNIPEELVSMAERYKASKLKRETEKKMARMQGKPNKFY